MHLRYLRLTSIVLALLCSACTPTETPSRDTAPARVTKSLTVAISPYQDIAMIVNARPLGLEDKYGVHLDLRTMAWEDIIPAVASSGRTVDIGFGSLIEYLTKQEALNPPGSDPVLFVYPVYVFKGGAFVTFDPKIGALDKAALKDPQRLKTFLRYRIGAQKSSVYEMIIYSLARRAGVDPKSLRIFDTPLNDGILATQQGSLDIAEAGLTQITEARKRGGRTLLTMEDAGFADITGFIVKKSVLDAKKTEIQALVRMWFDSTRHVMTDLDRNSGVSLEYLRKNASTQYTIDQYKTALSQEYFPVTTADAHATFVAPDGSYNIQRISDDVGEYLVAVGKTKKKPTPPDILAVP